MFFGLGDSAARHRNVTICPLVQGSAGENVVLLVPDVTWYVVALGAVIFLVYDLALSLFVGYMRKKLRLF